jgi:hypothetical protein
MYGMIDHQDSNFKQIHTAIYLVLANNPCPRRRGGLITHWCVNINRMSIKRDYLVVLRDAECLKINLSCIPVIYVGDET